MSTSPGTFFRKATKPFQSLQRISLRTRLILGIMLIISIAVLVLSYVFIDRRRQTTSFISNELASEVRQQAEQQLLTTAQNEAREADHFLQSVTNDVVVAADYMASLFAQEGLVGNGNYWDAAKKMTQLSEGQWGNPVTDPGSVLSPSSVTLTNDVISEINTVMYLDFVGPQILEANPNLLALFFISDKTGTTTYYPNIDLANIAGDFDARVRPYFHAVTPEVATDHGSYWSTPYVDAALNGIVQTNSAPVYDDNGQFRGVIGADVLLTTIINKVEGVQIKDTGYAFLIDSEGQFIALPERAFSDFGLDSNDFAENVIPSKTIFDSPAGLQDIAAKMVTEEDGLDTFVTEQGEQFFAFAPIPSTNYKLGVIVPVDQMIELYLTVNESVVEEENTTVQLISNIFLVLLAVALLFSYIFGRLFFRPIKQLIEAAEEISAGNLNIEVETLAGGEVGTLAKAFNNMSSQLSELIGDLEHRVAVRTHALETSSQVSHHLSTILNPTHLVSEIVNQVQQAFDYYHAHIYLFDTAGQNLVMVGGTGEAGQRMLENEHKIEQGRGLVGRAAATNEVVLAPDVTQEEGWLSNPLLPETKSEIAVPIAVGDRVLGVLDIQQNTTGSLTEEDARLLQSIANQVAIALRNAGLFEEAQKQAEREALLNMIGQSIQTASDVEGVLRVAARELGQALGAERASVQLAHIPNTNKDLTLKSEGERRMKSLGEGV